MLKLFKCSSAVRGYHYYQKYWQPTESQSLDCVREKENPFNYFAIKVMDQATGATVGHWPMENSRATKFLLDRVVRVVSVLTLTNYCVSPLVQGGLEVPCRVDTYMSPTVKNKQLIDMYLNYMDLLYYNRGLSNTLGSFLVGEESETPGSSKSSIRKDENNKNTEKKQIKSCHKDIRLLFLDQSDKGTRDPKTTEVTELVDTEED